MGSPCHFSSLVPTPSMHYSQQNATIRSTRTGHTECTKLSGFITAPILTKQFSSWDDSWETPPKSMLIDLQQVTGYGPGTVILVRSRLRKAQRDGVQSIALIAVSSVLKTAAHVLSQHLHINLQCFERRSTGEHWLGIHASLPSPSASEQSLSP